MTWKFLETTMNKNKLDNLKKIDSALVVKKGKRGLFSIIFGRTTLITLVLILQFYILFSVMYRFTEYSEYYLGGTLIITVVMILVITNSASNPTTKLAWIGLIALAPLLGMVLYIYIENDIGFRLIKKGLSDIIERTSHYLPKNDEIKEEIKSADPAFSGICQYMSRRGGATVYKNTSSKYFPIGEDFYASLLEELPKAKKFIFLEFFIVGEGLMWGSILDILKKKVAEGVEVRILYDGTCAFTLLPYDYPKKLEKLGIKCKMFSPVRPLISSHYNNRDHRKIVVIDGHTAYTGGINLADEYINKKVLHGHWKDVGIMIKGPAVRSFTLMFLQMWNLGEKRVNYSRFLDEEITPVADADGYVMPYGDSPLDNELVGENVYIDILNTARDYVHIMTPYLIPDNELLSALKLASKRGVDVKLIMPHIPDKKVIFALSKSYYRELIDAGVKIYEYTPGFVHAKMFVSDDMRAVVGSINLDYRSLYLHFECAVYLYGAGTIGDIVRDFDCTLAKCQLVTRDDMKKESLLTRFIGYVLKIFAPLT